MKVKLFIPMAGTLQVDVGDEMILLSLADLIRAPVAYDFPMQVPEVKALVPMTGLITIPESGKTTKETLKDE